MHTNKHHIVCDDKRIQFNDMQLYLNEHINHLTTFVGLFSLYSPLRWIIYYISIVKKVLKPRTKVEMTEKSISLYNRETEKIESIKLNEKFAIQKKNISTLKFGFFDSPSGQLPFWQFISIELNFSIGCYSASGSDSIHILKIVWHCNRYQENSMIFLSWIENEKWK